jgi:hypothetical protein
LQGVRSDDARTTRTRHRNAPGQGYLKLSLDPRFSAPNTFIILYIVIRVSYRYPDLTKARLILPDPAREEISQPDPALQRLGRSAAMSEARSGAELPAFGLDVGPDSNHSVFRDMVVE